MRGFIDGSRPAETPMLDGLLADPEIDAVYIATPHPGHAEWAIKAIRARPSAHSSCSIRIS